MQAALVLLILVGVVALLVSERVAPDVVALLALALLLLLRLIEPRDALSGFSNPATITVGCMFLLSAALERTGVVRAIADRVLEMGPLGVVQLLALLTVVVAPISALINNTAAVAIFLPVMLRVCRGNGISPSRVLMPLAFLAILGGTCTLIGTSTNILVSSMAEERGMRPFGMFEFTPLGLLWLAIGAAYLLILGRRLLPDRPAPEDLTAAYRVGEYLSELVVVEGSPLVGQTLDDVGLGERLGVQVLGMERAGKKGVEAIPGGGVRIEAGDLLLVEAPANVLLDLHRNLAVDVRPGRHPDDARLQEIDTTLLEAVIRPNSSLEGRSLKEVDFRHRYGAVVLALRRHGSPMLEKIGRVKLRAGDELLILARRRAAGRLRRPKDFVVLQQVDPEVPRPGRAAIATAVVFGVVAGSAAGLFPVVVGALAGAVIVVLTGCVPARGAYASIEWKVLVLLAGIIPLGRAIETSGAAELLVRGLLAAVGEESPRLLLVTFAAVTYLLTGFMSNAATAALMVPLGITSAALIGADARPFLVTIMFAASAAFYTPVGYQTNLLVYGPGGYRFSDYVRVGGPLNLIYLAVTPWAIPAFFPF